MVDQENKRYELPQEPAPEASGTPAKAETVESKPSVPEVVRQAPEKISEQVPVTPAVVIPTPAAPAPSAKDPLTEEIEEILEEDLQDIYQHLPAERRAEFKEEGEKTAGIIKAMMEHGKLHGRRIVHLIIRWLRLIPGVNKFFLEQESKIKTDKLIHVAQEQHEKRL